MKREDIEYLKSFDYNKCLNEESSFYGDGLYYYPFILSGLHVDHEEAEAILKEIDPDLYVVGDNGDGLEISRLSFWGYKKTSL